MSDPFTINVWSEICYMLLVPPHIGIDCYSSTVEKNTFISIILLFVFLWSHQFDVSFWFPLLDYFINYIIYFLAVHSFTIYSGAALETKAYGHELF